jgi:hypothetical protein
VIKVIFINIIMQGLIFRLYFHAYVIRIMSKISLVANALNCLVAMSNKTICF